MTDSGTRRRGLLRIGGTLAVAGVFAGCQDLLGGGEGDGDENDDDGDGDPPDRGIGLVPGGAAVVYSARVDALRETDAYRSGDEFLPTGDGQGPATGLDPTRLTFGVDPEAVEYAVGFGLPIRQAGGGVVWTDWTDADVQEAAASGDDRPPTDTYADRTVYVTEQGGWIAPFGGGTFGVGSPQAVRPLVDVFEGEADPVDNVASEEYEGTDDALLRAGFVVPGVVRQNASGTLRSNVTSGQGIVTDEDGSGLVVTLRTGSVDDAGAVREHLEGRVRALRVLVAGSFEGARRDRFEAVLDGMSVTRDGSTVTLSNESGPETLAVIGGAVATLAVEGVEGLEELF